MRNWGLVHSESKLHCQHLCHRSEFLIVKYSFTSLLGSSYVLNIPLEQLPGGKHVSSNYLLGETIGSRFREVAACGHFIARVLQIQLLCLSKVNELHACIARVVPCVQAVGRDLPPLDVRANPRYFYPCTFKEGREHIERRQAL